MFELQKLFNKYFAFGGEIIPMGKSDKDLIKIKDCIIKGVFDRDCPDGYYKIGNNEVLIMEHFCFDSTEIKKGSESLAEMARIERENNKHDSINCSINITNYWENLKENFRRHYLKINKYKENLIKEGIATKNAKFKVAFFVEDVTPLGNVDIKTQTRVRLIFLDKFIELFRNSTNLDYIFSFSEVGSSKEVTFVTKDNIDALLDNKIKVEEVELIPWKPQVSSFTFKAPV